MATRSHRLLSVTITLALTAANASSQTTRVSGKRAVVEAKTVSISELVNSADRIFVGEVAKIAEVPLNLPSGPGSIQVEEVTLNVKQVLKSPPPQKGSSNELAENQPYVVRRAPGLTRAVKVGETVLWYLAKESNIGLSAPVGVASGDFMITSNGGAINQKANAGLFQPADVTTLATAASRLSVVIPGEQEKANFVAATGERSRVLARTSAAGQPLPLDGLVSTTRVLVGGSPPVEATSAPDR